MENISNFAKSFSGGDSAQTQQSQSGQSLNSEQQQGSGGFLGGIGDKLNSAAGGGRKSEKNEDMLDKGSSFHLRLGTGLILEAGIDFVQERFMGQGPQDNESAGAFRRKTSRNTC